jgi:dinuclear metal center YbgI/SA1388 family protein
MKSATLTASDFNDLVSSLAPPELACPWDHVGFQIGSPVKRVKRVLCALEVTPAVISEAESRKAQLILVHHPLIFHPLASVTDASPVGRLVMRLIKKDLCLIVAHTNLDKSPHGTNHALARLLGLSDIGVLVPEGEPSGESSYGMGCVGNLPRKTPLRLWAEKVRDRLGVEKVQVAGDDGRKVQRVAVLSGAGGEEILRGNLSGADAVVTGEISHHTALEAVMQGMAVICAGHFATEVVGMAFFARALGRQEKIKKAEVEILIAKSQTSPYIYY